MSDSPPPSDGVMEINNLMDKDKAAEVAAVAAAAAAASAASAQAFEQSMSQQHLQTSIMDQANSPHESEASYHSVQRQYGSPSALQAQLPLPDSIPQGMMITHLPPVGQGMSMAPQQPPPAKNFSCGTCQKRFARRSDLARHERIHSGVRPHVCDFEGCGKQFIQRSALTVHQRVHTGEKPHMCECCGKPFSDSSSLARHRRIHLGTRPYQCSFANCLKTFTRRTTLTRHQQSHTETLEEAAAATAKRLTEQATKMAPAPRPVHTDGAEATMASNHASPLNTPSPAQRQSSNSPTEDPATSAMPATDFSYMGNGTLPVHLRPDVNVNSAPTTTLSTFAPVAQPTSHPTAYAPPPTLEPSVESHQSTGGSTGDSPHIGGAGWQSPSHAQSPSHMPSPTYSNDGVNSSVYPELEPHFQANGVNPMYSYGTQMRRANSTEPTSSTTYDVKPRSSELWASQ